MNGLALCAGIGGLELGIKLAIPSYRTVCCVESDREMKKTKMKKYIKPSFKRVKGLRFIFRALRTPQRVCRQCSHCHGCR